MDIKIEAPGHNTQLSLQDYYTSVLLKKYGEYPFINAVDVKIKTLHKKQIVSLQMKPEKGKLLFVESSHINEQNAFMGAIKKMNTLIEKYKQKHYHKRSTHKNI